MQNSTESIEKEINNLIKLISAINKSATYDYLRQIIDTFKNSTEVYGSISCKFIFSESAENKKYHFYNILSDISISKDLRNEIKSLNDFQENEIIESFFILANNIINKHLDPKLNTEIDEVIQLYSSNRKYNKKRGREKVMHLIENYDIEFFDDRLKVFHHDIGLILATYKYLLLSKKSTNEDMELFKKGIPREIKNRKHFISFLNGIYFSSYFPTFEQNVIQSIDEVNKLSKEALANKKIILRVIRQYPHIFAECSDKLRNDKNFILKAMKINNNIFPYLPKHLKNDVDIAIMATDIEYFLSHITTAILQDKRIVQKFIHSKPSNIDYLQSSGKLNFDLYDDEMIYPFVESNTIAFNKLSKRLQNKKKFILAALSVKYPSSELFNELPLKFRKDRKIALKAIKKYETSYSHLCDSLKNNERFLLRALKENNDLAGTIVRENPQIFLNSKLLALYIVKKYNNAISFLSEDLRNDKEIIINAVIGAQSSSYFNLIPEHFWNDKTVVLKAIENEENYLEFASQEIQDLCQDFDPIDFDPIEALTKAIEVEKLHKELEVELPPTEQQIEPTRKKLKKI